MSRNKTKAMKNKNEDPEIEEIIQDENTEKNKNKQVEIEDNQFNKKNKLKSLFDEKIGKSSGNPLNIDEKDPKIYETSETSHLNKRIYQEGIENEKKISKLEKKTLKEQEYKNKEQVMQSRPMKEYFYTKSKKMAIDRSFNSSQAEIKNDSYRSERNRPDIYQLANEDIEESKANSANSTRIECRSSRKLSPYKDKEDNHLLYRSPYLSQNLFKNWMGPSDFTQLKHYYTPIKNKTVHIDSKDSKLKSDEKSENLNIERNQLEEALEDTQDETDNLSSFESEIVEIDPSKENKKIFNFKNPVNGHSEDKQDCIRSYTQGILYKAYRQDMNSFKSLHSSQSSYLGYSGNKNLDRELIDSFTSRELEASLGILKLKRIFRDGTFQEQGYKYKTNLQTNVLNDILQITPYPNAQMRDTIAILLNLNPRTVQIWFQNARQGGERQMTREEIRKHKSDIIVDAKTLIQIYVKNYRGI